MGLRTKLLLPIVLTYILFVMIVHFVWAPSALERLTEDIMEHEEEVLQSIEPSITRSMLNGDLASIYNTLEWNNRIHRGEWKEVVLFNMDGKRLYPLKEPKDAKGKHIAIVNHELTWDGRYVGSIRLYVDMEKDIAKEYQVIYELEWWVLSLFGMLLVLGLWWQSLTFLRPLNSMEKAAKQLVHGNFDTVLPRAPNDELGHLIHAFDTMRTGLQETQKSLVHAKEDAEKANKAKSVFLSRMSHELRTPMNAILGFGQLLELELKDSENSGLLESVREILNAGKHLLELINEVLDLATIEAGKLEISMKSVSLQSVVNECMKLLAPLAKQREITLKDNLSMCFEQSVCADFTRLKQVMLNLMSNAIKYNKIEGSVIVHCDKVAPDRLRITIEDTGHGLSESQQQLLFQPFERLSENAGIEGTGIGLVVSKHLVEAMGGTIGVDSEEGGGCKFWIELGIGEELKIAATNDHDENMKLSFNNGSYQRKLLCIEDNPANMKLVKQLLEKCADIELACATDGMSGIELAKSLVPDLILLDINLPDINGFEVLNQLSKIEQTRNIPVVAISANAMPEELKDGIKAGFSAYITKPVNIKQFYQVIDDEFDAMRARQKEI